MAAAERFQIDVPEAVLARIWDRLETARIGARPSGEDPWCFGTDASYLAEFVAYWRDRYDWRAHEAELNRWPQYRVRIGDAKLHFYHVRGDGSHALPIILTHGWPGSTVEFQAAMPNLVAAGFDIVVPSLPGFGWSGPCTRPMGPHEIAGLWRTLMTDILGYRRFFAQGGDAGALVTTQLALHHADAVAAIHLNFFLAPPLGPANDAEVTAYWQAVRSFMDEEGAYIHQQVTRPQTLGLALHDNPVGWASWTLEKFRAWADTGGDLERSFTKDQLITNLMTYLVTDTVITSLWIYGASHAENATATPRVGIPTALARFPAERFPMPDRGLASRQYDLARWREMSRGGHFAAMEEPALFAQDVIAFFSGQE